MNIKVNCSLISSWLLIIAISAFAENATIYRWIDKDNIVHFSQHQPESGHFTEMNIANTAPSEVNLVLVTAPTKNNEEYIEDDDVIHSTEELFKSEMNEKCQEAKTNVTTLKSFDNIQTTDDEGKKSLLTQQQKKQQLEMNLKRIEIYCSDNSD